jgi:putative MATE family efflux protein
MSSDIKKPDPRASIVRDLTVGSIPRHLLAFSMPMLAGSVLQTAYSVINAFWVGKLLGADALAAITVSLPAVFVLVAVAGGLTLATNVLIAQYVGASNFAGVKRVVRTSVSLVGGVSLLLLFLGLLLAPHLLRIMNTPADIFPLALGYLRIFLWTLPLSFGIFLISSMLRGIGDSQTPVYFQAVSVGFNALLDPLLMFGWLGFPRLGLNGTAWATIIAQGAAVVALLIYVPRKRPLIVPNWLHLGADGPTTWLLVKIGFPTMIQQTIVSSSMLVIVSLVSSFGSKTDAAFGAALRIDQIAFLPAMTVGMAISTLAGQNIGAKQFRRVQEVFRWGILLSGSICLLISLLAISLPGILLRAFLNEPEAIAIGVQYLHIVGITYLLYAVMFVSNGIINGAGHTLATTLMTAVSLLGFRVPLATILARHLHSQVGIWIGMLISVACGMLLSLAYYLSGRWKRSVIRSAF